MSSELEFIIGFLIGVIIGLPIAYFIITRFDYLAKVGEILYGLENRMWQIFNFRERLLSFTNKFNRDQKISAYKIIFRFLGEVLSEGKIDFSFLHNILRHEIMDKKRKGKKLFLSGFNYLKAFLEAKKEV